MNIHSFLDNFTISLSALLLPKSKFFRDSIESLTFSEHLQGINLQLPEIMQEGQRISNHNLSSRQRRKSL